MAPRRPTGLAERLAPHVPRRFDPAVYAWWLRRPARWPWVRRQGGRAGVDGPVVTHGRRRTAQLAPIVERLATLLVVGHDLRAAVEHVVGTGRGPVVAELAPVATQLAAGVPAAAAVRSWARRASCPHVAQLAADLRGCAGVTDTAGVLERHARLLRRQVLRDQLRTLRRRTAVLWLAALVTCATTAVVVAA